MTYQAENETRKVEIIRVGRELLQSVENTNVGPFIVWSCEVISPDGNDFPTRQSFSGGGMTPGSSWTAMGTLRATSTHRDRGGGTYMEVISGGVGIYGPYAIVKGGSWRRRRPVDADPVHPDRRYLLAEPHDPDRWRHEGFIYATAETTAESATVQSGRVPDG